MGRGRLHELVDQVNTKAHGRKLASSPYVGLEHIEPGARSLTSTAPSSVSESTNGVFEKGDVLFGKLRPNLRKAVQVDFGGYCSTDLLVLRPRAGVDTRYAGHVVSSEAVFRHAERNSIGTGMPRTSWHAVSQARVWAPPLEAQRRIAEILDTIDEAIQATERLVAKLTAVRVGLLCELLAPGMSPSPPPEWGVSRVEELLACRDPAMRSGPFGSTLLASDLVDEGVPLLGIDNVQREYFVADYRRFVTPAKANELRRYRVFPRDLMITIMGTVGRCCVVPEAVGNALSSKHVWTLTLDSERYVPELACLQMNYSPWALAHFGRDEQGGIMSAIRSETLRSLRLPTPPLAVQREIWAVLHEASCGMEAQNAILSKLRITRHGLAADLLSGRVRTVAA